MVTNQSNPRVQQLKRTPKSHPSARLAVYYHNKNIKSIKTQRNLLILIPFPSTHSTSALSCQSWHYFTGEQCTSFDIRGLQML